MFMGLCRKEKPFFRGNQKGEVLIIWILVALIIGAVVIIGELDLSPKAPPANIDIDIDIEIHEKEEEPPPPHEPLKTVLDINDNNKGGE